jgi:diketogulonate reductase-like aldo/keto reductase
MTFGSNKLILQIHAPIRIKKGTTLSPENLIPTDILATWGVMEKLYDSGKARAIGVSNFSCKVEDLFMLEIGRIKSEEDQTNHRDIRILTWKIL